MKNVNVSQNDKRYSFICKNQAFYLSKILKQIEYFFLASKCFEMKKIPKAEMILRWITEFTLKTMFSTLNKQWVGTIEIILPCILAISFYK